MTRLEFFTYFIQMIYAMIFLVLFLAFIYLIYGREES